MNKQEIIEKIKEMTVETFFSGTLFVKQKEVIKLIEQLDEPEKVKIPEFVANIIEEYKERNAPIIDIFTEKYSDDQYNTWLIRSLNAYDRAARAWLDGYEVEKTKEALYTVTLKSSGQKLFYHEKDEEYLFSNYAKCFLKEHHTRKELEQSGFGWVFDCPGIEVEEVQDA